MDVVKTGDDEFRISHAKTGCLWRDLGTCGGIGKVAEVAAVAVFTVARLTPMALVVTKAQKLAKGGS